MANKERKVTEIDEKGTRSRPILSLKNRDQMRKIEKEEDCLILEFDPHDGIELQKPSRSKGFDDADLCVVAEKEQVACRDYPHSRHNCAKYPFERTPHHRRGKLCYCYVSDSAAPCEKWAGSSGHCHAFNTEFWDKKRKSMAARDDNPHFRHSSAKYPFGKTAPNRHCKLCYCYFCEKWARHCHASCTEAWDVMRKAMK